MVTTFFLLSPPTEVLTNLIKFSIPRISAPRSQSIPQIKQTSDIILTKGNTILQALDTSKAS